MKTFRRDRLLRLAKAGKLVAVDSYHFDDQFGVSESAKKQPKPVKVIKGGADFDSNAYCVYESDFSGHGRAWLNENGTVTLIVHSNLNYTFKIVE